MPVLRYFTRCESAFLHYSAGPAWQTVSLAIERAVAVAHFETIPVEFVLHDGRGNWDNPNLEFTAGRFRRHNNYFIGEEGEFWLVDKELFPAFRLTPLMPGLTLLVETDRVSKDCLGTRAFNKLWVTQFSGRPEFRLVYLGGQDAGFMPSLPSQRLGNQDLSAIEEATRSQFQRVAFVTSQRMAALAGACELWGPAEREEGLAGWVRESGYEGLDGLFIPLLQRVFGLRGERELVSESEEITWGGLANP